MTPSLRGKFFFSIGILSFLLVWAISSFFVDSAMLLPSPDVVLSRLISYLFLPATYHHIFSTFLRIALGISTSGTLGIAIGIACGKSPALFGLVQPWTVVFQSLPAIVWVLIGLLWLPRTILPLFLVFLTTFPLWIIHIRQAVKSIDPHTLEMANVFALHGIRRWYSVYFPPLLVAFVSTFRATLTLSIKIVVMAEVLAFPAMGIGSRLFWAKTYVNIEDLFAWASMLFITGWILDGLVFSIEKWLKKHLALSAL